MNNPDEETAVEQFGKGDKYFGICMMLITMPGLPMIGHGQIEGFSEKYGMEYKKAYYNEIPDGGFIARHEWEIFPLMKKITLRKYASGISKTVIDMHPKTRPSKYSGRHQKFLPFTMNQTASTRFIPGIMQRVILSLEPATAA